jgi:hypothetical protein
MSVYSPNCGSELAFACVALICYCTLIHWHTRFRKHVDRKNFAGNENFELIESKINCLLQNGTILSCTIVDGLRSGFSEQNVHASLV